MPYSAFRRIFVASDSRNVVEFLNYSAVNHHPDLLYILDTVGEHHVLGLILFSSGINIALETGHVMTADSRGTKPSH